MTTQTPSLATQATGRAVKGIIQMSLIAGPFMSMVDSNIVNVALPDIARQLGANLVDAQWIISGYLLALAMVLPASAFLARRFGTRRMYLASLLGFTLASLSCAFAPTLPVLIVARLVQGALGAPLVPLAMSLLLGKDNTTRQFPVAGGIVLFLAPALGPTLGGLLIHAAGWPLIFLINVPIGILGALGVARVPDDATGTGDRTARFDPLGMLVLAAGMGLASYATTEGAQRGWLLPDVWPLWAGGFGLLALAMILALVRQHPPIDVRLMRHSQASLSIALSTLASVVMFAMLFLIPIYVQDLQGKSALEAGLVLLLQGLVTGVGTLLGNALGARWGVRWTVLAGMIILAVSTALLLLTTITTPTWETALLLSGRGLAIGLAIQPLLLALTGDLVAGELADANTIFNVAERLGGSFGIALLATFFQQRELLHVQAVLQPLGINAGSLGQGNTGSLPPQIAAQLSQAVMTGFHDTIWLLVALSCVGIVAALLLHNRHVQSSA